jgi:hypothetical protein
LRDAPARPGIANSLRASARVQYDPSDPDCGRLPRKEVIQPQLPLRLPCYDFVPITHPTLDASVPCGFGQRLQVLPAFMT